MPNQDDPTDLKLAAAEARTETKVVRLEGKIDLVLQKLDSNAAMATAQTDEFTKRLAEVRVDVKDDNRAVRANQWVIFFGLVLLIVAIAALVPVFFGIGTQIRDMVHMEVQSQAPQSGAKK